LKGSEEHKGEISLIPKQWRNFSRTPFMATSTMPAVLNLHYSVKISYLSRTK